MRLFDKTILRLTGIYTALLMVLSISFSVAFYVCIDQSLNQPIRPGLNTRRSIIWEENGEFYGVIRQRDADLRSDLWAGLAFINTGVLIFGALASYFLARITLKPVNDAMEAQSRFVSDASHELKTPLAAIAMENEVLLRDKKVTKADLEQQVASNLEEVKKLQRLSDTLLQITTNEKVVGAVEREAVIEQIVKTLVENAVKYDPEHRQPQIERSDKQVKVIDAGPGIAPEDLPHIFERFYRGEKSRTSDGLGLGLSLAQNLAKQIGARVTVENNHGKPGTTFTLML
ncbi:MAG: sensor histidine kinase [Candidatus Nomurabacteria bacterium]|nr:sensor histidine kinase [Candidatus Nomurabacteria bacterium]